jgi:hypothetical protein
MEVRFDGVPEKRPMRLGRMQVIDMETGEVIEEKANAMTLLPAREGTCPECGTDHPHADPHNQQSLFYQYRFYATHGRWPTWTDAMAHCPDAVRAAWREHLVAEMRSRGMKVPPDLELRDPAAGR